jgi:hypothetical protein
MKNNILVFILLLLPTLAISQKNKSTKDVKTVSSSEALIIKNRDLLDSISNLNKKINSFEKEKSQAPLTISTDSTLKNTIDSLKKIISERGKENPQFEKLKIENNLLRDSLKLVQKEKDQLVNDAAISETTLKAKNVEIKESERQNSNLKKELEKKDLASREYNSLMNLYFKNLGSEINSILAVADFKTQKSNIEKINAEIENFKKLDPSISNSLNVFVDKLNWYINMAEAIENSKKILDIQFDTEKVKEAYIKLNNIQNSPISKPTVEQIKLIEAQKTLLNDYCGSHNYVASKMADANSYITTIGADKDSILEEIDAALKRTDKGYSFLIKKLEERKKNPANKTLTIERVNCPKE